MLLFGKVLAFVPSKWVFLATISVFEVGSLLCAVSTSVNFLIFGRVFSGIGAAGIWVSVLTTITNVCDTFICYSFTLETHYSTPNQITRLEQRALLLGSFGIVFAISSVVGPLLGGVLSGTFLPNILL